MGNNAHKTKKTLQNGPGIEEKNSEMHGVERGTVWSGDMDAKLREELGSV